jgi:hypothetical protein
MPSEKAKVKTMKKYFAPLFALPLIAGLTVAAVGAQQTAGGTMHIKDKTKCMHTWKAYKAQFRSDHKSRGEFMRECRAGTLPPLAKGTRTQ